MILKCCFELMPFTSKLTYTRHTTLAHNIDLLLYFSDNGNMKMSNILWFCLSKLAFKSFSFLHWQKPLVDIYFEGHFIILGENKCVKVTYILGENCKQKSSPIKQTSMAKKFFGFFCTISIGTRVSWECIKRS